MLVSILIPVYNREKMIGPCIESALDQTYPDIEIIVVDNASTDRTWDVCLTYAHCYSRVRIYRNDNNIGPVRNWLRCIEKATGEYGKILFSDDLMARQFVEKTVPFFEDGEVGLVFTATFLGENPDRGNVQYRLFNKTGKYASDCFINGLLYSHDISYSPGCAIFRVADLRKNLKLDIPSSFIHDFRDHGAGPDMMLYLLTAQNYRYIAYVHELQSFFRSHKGSISIDRRLNLEFYYRQARIWFGETYLNADGLRKLYSHIWLEECWQQMRWTPPLKVMGKYTYNPIKVTLLCRVKALTNKIGGRVAKWCKRLLKPPKGVSFSPI